MSDKRRVVKGPKDASVQAKRGALSKYGDKVQDSVKDTLAGADLGYQDAAGNSLDQYPAIVDAQAEDGTVNRKIVGPKEESGGGLGGSAKSTPQVPKYIVQDNRPQDHQEKRARDIGKLMNAYNKANQERSFRARNTGTRAASIALSNPAAAQQLAAGRKQFQNEPIDSITGGLKAGQQGIDLEQDVTAQAGVDQERDPNSKVTQLAKQQLLNEFGITAPEGSTAQDIKRVFPMIKVDTQRDTQYRSQNLTDDQKRRQREARQSQFVRGEQGKNYRTNVQAQAQLENTVVGKTLGQTQSSGGGSGRSGGLRDAKGWTFSNAMPQAGGEYLVRDQKQGPPADQQVKGQVDSNDAFGRFNIATRSVKNYVEDVKSGQVQFSPETWGSLMSLYQQAISNSVKFNGNGVANGPDIEQAAKEVGDADSLLGWVTGGNMARLEAASSQAKQKYINGAKLRGYNVSKTPSARSDISSMSGSGGGGRMSGPVNDASQATGQILNKRGLAPIKRNVATPTPQTPPIPPKSDFIPGQQYDTTNGPAIFVGINPQTGKRQWKAVSK